MTHRDVWESPAYLHHGQICLTNVIDFCLSGFDVVSHGIFTAKFVRYSLSVWTVSWRKDWRVSSGERLDNEASRAKYSVLTLGTSVLMSSHLTQGLYVS